MGYCSASDVAALTSHITLGASNFSASTHPTLTQVNVFIASGSALLNTLTTGRGYALPASTADIYGLYVQMNALYAAWMAERQRTSDQTTPGAKSRADLFYADLKWHVQVLFGQDLDALDLASAGLGAANSVGPWAGGTNVMDVENAEADYGTTTVAPRFTRGISTSFRDTLRPSKIASKD